MRLWGFPMQCHLPATSVRGVCLTKCVCGFPSTTFQFQYNQIRQITLIKCAYKAECAVTVDGALQLRETRMKSVRETRTERRCSLVPPRMFWTVSVICTPLFSLTMFRTFVINVFNWLQCSGNRIIAQLSDSSEVTVLTLYLAACIHAFVIEINHPHRRRHHHHQTFHQ